MNNPFANQRELPGERCVRTALYGRKCHQVNGDLALQGFIAASFEKPGRQDFAV